MDFTQVLQFRSCNPDDSSYPPDFDAYRLLDALNRLFSHFPRCSESLDTGIPICCRENQYLLTPELVHSCTIVCAKHRYFSDWFGILRSRPTELGVCFSQKWDHEWKLTDALSSGEKLRVALVHIIVMALNMKAELLDEFLCAEVF